MKHIIILLSIATLLFLHIFTNSNISSYKSSQDNQAITMKRIDSQSNMNKIYNENYQESIHQAIEKLKNDTYTLQTPLVLENPYHTNTTSLYLYFTTNEKVKIKYTVQANGYKDFSQILYSDYTKEHEYQLIGIVPNCTNTITLEAINEQQEIVDSKTFTYDAPQLLSGDEYTTLEVTNGSSMQEVSSGLYTILGNDTTENDDDIDYIYLYDNDGVIRGEIPILSYRAHRLLFDDQTMYYSASSQKLVGMNNLGQITHIYNTGQYQLHHDYIFGSQDDFIVLASESNTDTKEDKIISINKKSGDIIELVDLEELFKEYRKTLSSSSTLDWMHINSIELIGDSSIIISSRETSTIIKIDNIYTNPTIDYMIGSNMFWSGTSYQNLLLQQVGNFSLNAGQHCLSIQYDNSLKDGQYYLSLYNNNNTYCSSRKYDYSKDVQYYNTGTKTTGNTSYYYQYLIDENKRTFTLISKIPVTYSGYVSSVQHIDNNLIIDSGSAFEAVELDSQNNIIQTIKGTGDTWWYRVFKYTYNNFWFSE